jgi:hypothetical protein
MGFALFINHMLDIDIVLQPNPRVNGMAQQRILRQ